MNSILADDEAPLPSRAVVPYPSLYQNTPYLSALDFFRRAEQGSPDTRQDITQAGTQPCSSVEEGPSNAEVDEESVQGDSDQERQYPIKAL